MTEVDQGPGFMREPLEVCFDEICEPAPREQRALEAQLIDDTPPPASVWTKIQRELKRDGLISS